MPAHATHVLILYNPTAGAGDRVAAVRQLAAAISEAGLLAELVEDLRRLEHRSRELFDQGALRAVVAAGGDGTAETVANLTPEGTPLAVLPLGTENLLAKYLGISADPTMLAELIRANTKRRFDVGQLTTADGKSRLFLLMMGCGFDAEVIRRLHETRQGHITHLSYAKPILDSIREYGYPAIRVIAWEGGRRPRPRQIHAHWAFVFNTPSYAIGLAICPNADPTDGLLDVVTFRGGSFWSGLIHLANVLIGRQQRSRRVHMVRVKRLRIESDAAVPFQIDGDPGGELPVEIEVLPERLTMLVPT